MHLNVIAKLKRAAKTALAGAVLTGCTYQLGARDFDNNDRPDDGDEEVMQVVDSTASEFIHNDVRSTRITVHALLTDKAGDDVPLTMVCLAHGVIGFHACRRLAPGEYHFRREKGNRVSIIAHSFDRKEHEIRFTVVEFDNAE